LREEEKKQKADAAAAKKQLKTEAKAKAKARQEKILSELRELKESARKNRERRPDDASSRAHGCRPRRGLAALERRARGATGS
jgi:hypothetical protein